MAKRTKSTIEAQKAYESEKLAAGEHVAISLKLKTAKDLKALASLQNRFPDMTPTGIVRMAFRELAAKGNRK